MDGGMRALRVGGCECKDERSGLNLIAVGVRVGRGLRERMDACMCMEAPNPPP